MKVLSGAQALIFGFERMGVKNLYGMIGTSVLGFFDALYAARDRIRYVSCRHEQVAAAMADAEGRLTGRPGLAVVHAGPGALNAAISVGNAYKDGSPLMLLVGTVKSRLKGTDGMLELNHADIFKSFVKGVYRVESVSTIPALLNSAYRACMSGAKGPVVIEVPEDLWKERDQIDEEAFCFETDAPPIASDGDLKAVLQALQAASRPLLLAGAGVTDAGACAELEAFAQACHLPVATTGNGRGVLSEEHVLSLGRLGFGGGNPVADAAYKTSDFILGIGCGISDMVTYEFTAQTDADICLINLDGSGTAKPVYIDRHLHCDAKAALIALNRLANQTRIDPPSEWMASLAPVKKDWQEMLRQAAGQDKEPLSPSFVFTALDQLLSPQAIVCGGAGLHVVYANNCLKARGPGQFLASVNFGAMGFGLAAAMAAKLVFPDRPVVAVLGDGEFLMTVQDLETAVREHIGIKIFVVNDNCFRVLEFKQKMNYQGRVIGTRHGNPDLTQLARSFGMKGVRIEAAADVALLLAQTLAHDGPVLVEIVTHPDDLPPTNLEAALKMGAA